MIPDYISDEAQDLINKLLEVNPKKRLGYGNDGANKIKQHPYFKGVNWDDAWNQKLKPPFIPNLKDDMDLSCFDTLFTGEKVDSDAEISPTSISNDFT